MSTIHTYSKLVNALLLGNFIWRGGNAYFMVARGRGVLYRYSYARPIEDIAVDSLRLVGGMNAAIALMSFLGLRRSVRTQEIRGTELWILAAASFTQCVYHLSALRSGRWMREIGRIAAVEALLAIVSFIFASLTLRYHRNIFIRHD
ncbi:hypothetical protein PROFUN_01244 [Planoprotostelium fungivorum]|uniref:Transmembrane protein n=1 Tax=Planoprotostelium fungivorum TaxID=1890364 RepID=A0A2P6NZK0_9EUKA|nr:hypothetical protein PROFUN_01244 [Planoprotostelium fungivorum]